MGAARVWQIEYAEYPNLQRRRSTGISLIGGRTAADRVCVWRWSAYQEQNANELAVAPVGGPPHTYATPLSSRTPAADRSVIWYRGHGSWRAWLAHRRILWASAAMAVTSSSSHAPQVGGLSRYALPT